MNKKTRPPTHPGGILKRHYLEPLHLTVSATAKALSISRKTLSEIVNERCAISPDMALRLSKAFRTSPTLWTNMQQAYDLWHASHASQSWQHVRILMPPSAQVAFHHPGLQS